MKKLLVHTVLVLIAVISIGVANAEELSGVYQEVFIGNSLGDVVYVDGSVSVKVEEVQWMSYEEYAHARNIDKPVEYKGHCTVVDIEIKNLQQEEISGRTLIDDMEFVYFDEPNSAEEEVDGGEWVGWINWEAQYVPQLQGFLDPTIDSVEVVKVNGEEINSTPLGDFLILPGDSIEVVAVYSSWDKKIERENITAIRIGRGDELYMISVNAPCHKFSDPEYDFNEDELPTLLIPLKEIGVDYLSIDARVEYFDGSYYGNERQLYCDAVKEFQRICGIEETGDYDLLTRMWLNHKRINCRQ